MRWGEDSTHDDFCQTKQTESLFKRWIKEKLLRATSVIISLELYTYIERRVSLRNNQCVGLDWILDPKTESRRFAKVYAECH